MELISNKIIIVFETNNLITSDEIKSSLVIKRKYSDIYTLDEIYKDSNILKNYNYLLDCTFENKIFKQYLNNKKGILIKEKYDYIKTSTNKIILAGPNISQLTVAIYNKDMNEIFEKNINEYRDKVLFLTNKDPEYKNLLNFEKAINEGIDFSDFVKVNNNNKTYKLINKIPDKKEENVIYVTPENIEILHKLIEISKKILF